MKAASDLAVILLNWEQAHRTLDAVHRISAWKRVCPLIIVVDNGSSDSDKSILEKGVKGHHLIQNSYNKGFAGGNNDGISLAIAEGSTNILLLNTDVEVTEECIEHLLSGLETNHELGVIGPLLEVDGRIFAGGRNIGIYSNTQVLFSNYKKVGDILPVDYVSGTVFLARAETFTAAGLLAEDYFFSGEIADFCYRIRRAGYICAICTICTAVHNIETTFLRITLYPYYSIRNRFLYVQRNTGYLFPVLTAKWVMTGMMYSAIAYFQGKRSLSRSLMLAVKDGVTGRFGNQHQRILSKICQDSSSS